MEQHSNSQHGQHGQHNKPTDLTLRILVWVIICISVLGVVLDKGAAQAQALIRIATQVSGEPHLSNSPQILFVSPTGRISQIELSDDFEVTRKATGEMVLKLRAGVLSPLPAKAK